MQLNNIDDTAIALIGLPGAAEDLGEYLASKPEMSSKIRSKIERVLLESSIEKSKTKSTLPKNRL